MQLTSWLGAPYQHQGCLKGVVCDCVGLIKGVAIALNLAGYEPACPEAKAFANDAPSPDPERMRQGLAAGAVVSPSALAATGLKWGPNPTKTEQDVARDQHHPNRR